MAALSDSRSLPDFDPFQNRLCRDIRNELSEGLMEMIAGTGIKMAYAVADRFKAGRIEPFMRDYIDDRLSRYRTVLEQIGSAGIPSDETYAIARVLWDQELFFEVHEWLEKKWLEASGTDKIILQALIRAAGTYVHLEHGRTEGARKMAAKAVESLILHKDRASALFDVERLIAKLTALDPVPPKLRKEIG